MTKCICGNPDAHACLRRQRRDRSAAQNHRDIAVLRAAFPECAVNRGWHLAGPGPARFGWAAYHPGGAVRYLGRTAHDAVQAILREIDARNERALDDERGARERAEEQKFDYMKDEGLLRRPR